MFRRQYDDDIDMEEEDKDIERQDIAASASEIERVLVMHKVHQEAQRHAARTRIVRDRGDHSMVDVLRNPALLLEDQPPQMRINMLKKRDECFFCKWELMSTQVYPCEPADKREFFRKVRAGVTTESQIALCADALDFLNRTIIAPNNENTRTERRQIIEMRKQRVFDEQDRRRREMAVQRRHDVLRQRSVGLDGGGGDGSASPAAGAPPDRRSALRAPQQHARRYAPYPASARSGGGGGEFSSLLHIAGETSTSTTSRLDLTRLALAPARGAATAPHRHGAAPQTREDGAAPIDDCGADGAGESLLDDPCLAELDTALGGDGTCGTGGIEPAIFEQYTKIDNDRAFDGPQLYPENLTAHDVYCHFFGDDPHDMTMVMQAANCFFGQTRLHREATMRSLRKNRHTDSGPESVVSHKDIDSTTKTLKNMDLAFKLTENLAKLQK